MFMCTVHFWAGALQRLIGAKTRAIVPTKIIITFLVFGNAKIFFINRKIDKFHIDRTLNCNRSHTRSCKQLQLFKTIRNFQKKIILE